MLKLIRIMLKILIGNIFKLKNHFEETNYQLIPFMMHVKLGYVLFTQSKK